MSKQTSTKVRVTGTGRPINDYRATVRFASGFNTFDVWGPDSDAAFRMALQSLAAYRRRSGNHEAAVSIDLTIKPQDASL
jgi:hypothetical protein